MARTGLRMMPTFPSPPLKFRTAGFPQYGFKASMSDRAFPQARNLKQLPAYGRYPAVCFYPSLASPTREILALCPRLSWSPRAAVQEAFPPYPRDPWLRFELCCLDPSSLTTPPCASLAGTLRLHVFALIRSAFAVRERLGDPRDLPYFCYRAFPTCSADPTPVAHRAFPLYSHCGSRLPRIISESPTHSARLCQLSPMG